MLYDPIPYLVKTRTERKFPANPRTPTPVKNILINLASGKEPYLSSLQQYMGPTFSKSWQTNMMKKRRQKTSEIYLSVLLLNLSGPGYLPTL